MKIRAMVAAGWIVMGVGAGLVVTACSSKGDVEVAQTGSVQLPLKAQGASGAEYRLRNAFFRITGASTADVDVEAHYNDDVIHVELPAGDYTVRLDGNWRMERTVAGATTNVEATLISAQTKTFTVEDQAVSIVDFQFKVGDDVVQFGHGVLRLTIGIDEGRACQTDSQCGAGNVCVNAQCMPVSGTTGCTSDAECASGETCQAGLCVPGGGGDCAGQTCSAAQWCLESTYATGCVDSGSIPVGGDCSLQADCVAGALCASDGTLSQCYQVCHADADCPSNLCQFVPDSTGNLSDLGLCVPGTSPGCTSDAECASGESCVNGACQPSTPPGCTSDAECASGESCVNGACQPSTPPSECAVDADCGAGRWCFATSVGGYCAQGGGAAVGAACDAADPFSGCVEDALCLDVVGSGQGVCSAVCTQAQGCVGGLSCAELGDSSGNDLGVGVCI